LAVRRRSQELALPMGVMSGSDMVDARNEVALLECRPKSGSTVYLYGSVGDEREEEAKAAKVQSLKRNIWTEFFTTVNPNARLQE